MPPRHHWEFTRSLNAAFEPSFTATTKESKSASGTKCFRNLRIVVASEPRFEAECPLSQALAGGGSLHSLVHLVHFKRQGSLPVRLYLSATKQFSKLNTD